jgi:hypothetical protein
MGYKNGLIYFDMLNVLGVDEAPAPPFFYHPGIGEMDEEFFEKEVRPNAELHKGALKQAAKLVRDLTPDAGLEIQHSPFG